MLAILLTVLLHGHHYGWAQPHNPHHRPPCSVVFHVGCAVIPPVPRQFPVPPPVPFPVPR